MGELLQDITTFILDTIFPCYCIGCDAEGPYLCSACQAKIQRCLTQRCIVCRGPSFAPGFEGMTHPLCQNSYTPARLITPFDYSDPVLTEAIIRGKYKFLSGMFEVMAQMLNSNLKTEFPNILNSNSILCPIPLSARRQRWRGFNQSKIICDALTLLTGIPTLELLNRKRNTAVQKDLSRDKRLQNVKDCFETTNQTIPPHSTIILVDDVVTTGATMLAATETIKLQYEVEVICLAVASD